MEYKKTITIKDVASYANVSISTVSRVLNNPAKVKRETVENVNRAIRELKFSCNSLHLRDFGEQALGKRVMIFMPNIFTEDLAEIARGASEELEKHDVDAFIWNANENTHTENRGLSIIRQGFVQGVIFITSCVEDLSLKDIVAKVPVAAIERTITEPDIDLINVDAEQGMDVLVDHLSQLGHQNIGLLCGDISSSNAITKTMAFKKALEKRGIPWNASSVISSGWSVGCGYQGGQQLLRGQPNTTAIICMTDILAFGAINGIHSMGLSCPDDVSVAGFDNAPSSAYQWPALTTLDFPCLQMGQAAAKKMMQRMDDPKVSTETLLFPMGLIQRDSTGICPKRSV